MPQYSFEALLATASLQQAELTAPAPQANDYFGYAVAIDGDTALVGAPLAGATDEGTAFVFVRSAGVWTLQQALSATDGAAGDDFGVAVALDGDTALIGADHHDLLAGGTNSGAAYVFTRSGTTWAQEAELAPSDHGYGGDRFGGAVDLDGDTALVGAKLRDAGTKVDAGAAYAFIRSAGIWSQQAKFALADPSSPTSDEFGCALAVDGDTALIGADFRVVPGKYYCGAAYIYMRTGGSWSLRQTLTAGDAHYSDLFGCAVALDGDRAVIGASAHEYPGIGPAGAVYTFTRTSGVWSQERELFASDPRAGDRFGFRVALDGDIIVVGAPFHDANALLRAGAAYVFWHTDKGWAECSRLTAETVGEDERSAQSVAVSGATVLVGSPQHQVSDATNAGVAFSYSLEAPPVTTATLSPELNESGWTLSPVTITLIATDGGSGLARTEYRQVGAESWNTYSEPLMVSWPGVSGYQYRSFATSGVYEAIKTVTVRIGWVDRPPVTTAAKSPAPNAAGWSSSPVTVTLATTYSFTDTAIIDYRLAGALAWTPYTGPFKVSALGTWTYEYRSTDLSGVSEVANSLVLRIGAKPKITGLSPTAARRGATVTISGTAFGKTRGTSYVLFGTKKCTSCVSWTNARVKVRVPTKAVFGATKVKLVTMIGTSNTKSFTVKR